MTHNKMTIDQIIKAGADISSSLYNLEKAGAFDKYDKEVYPSLRKQIMNFTNRLAWDTLYALRKEREENND